MYIYIYTCIFRIKD